MIIILTDCIVGLSDRCRQGWAALVVALPGLVVPAQAAPPQVVAVDGTLCDLTRTLAGRSVAVTCLIPPGGDPHSYRMKPSDRQALSQASLVVHVGLGLTPVARKIRSPGPVVAVGELALPGYRGNDPHIWHNPANSASMVSVLATQLAAVVPADQRATVAARAAKAKAVLAGLERWAGEQFASLPSAQRVLVTDHRSYSHLAQRYGLKELSMLDSYTTGGVLRPSSLTRITKAVQASGAKTLFTPSIPANKTLQRISRSTGLPIASTPLYGEGLASGQSAVATAISNVCTIVQGQGGRCNRSSAEALSRQWSSMR